MPPKIAVITGPTATGKTRLGVLLAQRLGGEVVSADSMQLYRGMDIGTAKPTPEEMQGVPHHLIDVAEPWENWSAARYVEAAGTACRDILARGRLPIVVGGTGLYIDSLVRGLGFAAVDETGETRRELEEREIRVSREDFNIDNMLITLRQYYKGGRYDFLLNSRANIDLLSKRFVVFEVDSIKENKELFPVVTIIIMEAFINKMRRLKGVRKQLIVEEAWKALSTANMAEYLRYMYKTVRKYYGEAIVVTQEVEDIISSPVVKEAIINNSDCKILLDQRKFMNRFDAIQSLLGLTDKEKAQILSINQSNDPSRKYKEVWIGLGGVQSAVYATEVSVPEYLAYTTEETEKVEVQRLAGELGGDMELAIRQLAEGKR